MAKTKRDSFVRENRPLSDWLLDLTSSQSAVKERAALIIMALQVGVAETGVEITPEMLPEKAEVHQADFEVAIRAAVVAPGFPQREFVEALMQTIEDGYSRYKEKIRRDRLRWADAPPIESINQLQKWFDAELAETADESDNAFTWASIVFNTLDRALLVSSERLAAWLNDRFLWLMARQAIERIGPAAVCFAPQLLVKLDAEAGKPEVWWWEGNAALVAAGREDAATIRALAARLTGEPAISGNAAAVLGLIGRPVLGVVPDGVERLMAVSRYASEFLRLASLGALGSIGAGRTDVADRLVEAITEGKIFEPGYAIAALRPEVVAADVAVPLLISRFGIFEEFDPDREYQGKHARLAEALARYGEAAAAALRFWSSIWVVPTS